MAPALFVTLVVWLAVWRATRLITRDKLLAPFREWVTDKTGQGSLRAYLVYCPWCMSMWLALPPATLVWELCLDHVTGVPTWFGAPMLTLAYSMLTGIGTQRLGGDH